MEFHKSKMIEVKVGQVYQIREETDPDLWCHLMIFQDERDSQGNYPHKHLEYPSKVVITREKHISNGRWVIEVQVANVISPLLSDLEKRWICREGDLREDTIQLVDHGTP